MDMSQKTINLLWTGGWDSTFRLLEIVFVLKRSVQPYYLIDPTRPSTLIEMQACDKIKALIAEKSAEAGRLIEPTIFSYVPDIPPNPDLTQKWSNLAKELPIGSQNEWLARYAEAHDIHDVEMSVENYIEGQFTQALISRLVGQGETCRLMENPQPDDWLMFERFTFPIRHLTKLDLKHLSEAHGFYDILKHSWFCHKPTADGKICGECVPCEAAKKKGLGHEFPPPPTSWQRAVRKIARLLGA